MVGLIRCMALGLSSLPLANSISLAPPGSSSRQHTRASFISTFARISSLLGPTSRPPALASDGAHPPRPSAAAVAVGSTAVRIGKYGRPRYAKTVVYQPLVIDVDGIRVPVASWRPATNDDDDDDDDDADADDAVYEHRISISKIGKFLAGWNLTPLFDRNFSLRPSSSYVRMSSPDDMERGRLPTRPSSWPVVLLAHGFLGSRFDLSHLGEALGRNGFLVLSPEYPESLAASYDVATRGSGSTTGVPIDRGIITDRLLATMTTEWGILPTSYGIVGHSLGCGTVDTTGDETWTRVCLAGGYPSLRGPKCLFVGSINDGAVPLMRAAGALRGNDFAFLDEEAARTRSWDALPSRTALIFRKMGDAAPNHISFLAVGPNDAMVDFLSPLLPVARALGIPVLDFDKYQLSRDSAATGEVVIPLIVDYLKQMMIPVR